MSKIKKPVPVYEDIRALVLSARQTIARGVDLLQVHTNYEIGRRIFEQEQSGSDRAEYGQELMKELATRLTEEFGGGFSLSNIKYMRQFYVAYADRVHEIGQTVSGQFKGLPISQTASGLSTFVPIVQTLFGQSPDAGITSQPAFSLSWSHYVFLIGLKPAERSFYEIEAVQQGWTLRELKRQFNAGLYERLALSRDKDSIRELARKGQHVANPQDLLKGPYVLEFLGLQEKASYSESELESAIVTHIENFGTVALTGFQDPESWAAGTMRFMFKRRRFPVEIILLCVRWYCKYGISYRDLVEMMQERGVEVDPSTIMRWVHRYAPELEKRVRWYQGYRVTSWRVDETYVRVGGEWKYLFRAVDKHGRLIDFMLSDRRNTSAAHRFLGKALTTMRHWPPSSITTDQLGSYPKAIRRLQREGKLSAKIKHRTCKYLNNIIEADHGALKRVIRPTRGFQTMRTAAATIKGFEVMRMIRRGHCLTCKPRVEEEVRFVNKLFEIFAVAA